MNRTWESYESSADKYNKKFSQYNPYRRQIGHYIEELPARARVLDMGCGTGVNAGEFSRAGFEVHGFDFSEAMLTIARENCPSGSFSRSSIQEYQPSERFDGVCLSFIIVHLPDEEVETLISRLGSLLNPEGLVYISFMSGKTPGYETTSFSDGEIFFNYFTKEWITALFTKDRFIPVYSAVEPYREPDGSLTEDNFLIFRWDPQKGG